MLKHLHRFRSYIEHHLQESEDLSKPFSLITLERDRFDRPTNSPAATFITRLLNKALYEARDKRRDWWQDSTIQALSPNTKRWLLELYTLLDAQGLINTTAFRDRHGREPQSPEERIKTLSGNHWGGHGRGARAETSTRQLPVPTPDVIADLMAHCMEEKDRTELETLYHTLFR